ncbi:MAG: transposase [Acidimicrobiales bacterium]
MQEGVEIVAGDEVEPDLVRAHEVGGLVDEDDIGTQERVEHRGYEAVSVEVDTTPVPDGAALVAGSSPVLVADGRCEEAPEPSHPEITSDRYHVVAKVNEAVDEVRRAESKHRAELKRSRYVWLKYESNLTARQREQLTWLTRPSMQLAMAHAARWRDDFNAFYDESDPEEAQTYLKRWGYRAERPRLDPIKTFVATVGPLGRHHRLAIQPAEQRALGGHELTRPGGQAPGPGLPLQDEDDHHHLPHRREALATRNPHDLARSNNLSNP